MSERASVFGDDDLDVTGFAPKPPARPEQVRGVAEGVGFRSRDPAPPPSEKAPEPPPRREQRRYRTGRNIQLNLKVRQEDLDAFYRIADETGQVLGEVFADAIAALQKERKSIR
ncbi:hypothetical protein RQ831_19365 [Roseomonas gilardii]|uniref:Stability/partitioning determinant n=1 Tax=Roseomonas gilardii TaxID=257708 RepID=A0ABU3MJN2_9PROT|nr:hypothetical protein [Roseomonas gilardii]MDT8333216.1 hypothetical protein [Roseomonas gilardii]PZR07752.1 MAG: stability/partitioning determinant [Azospirillum brasilense]